MPSPPRTETTLLLQSMGRGDAAAAEKVLPLVYDELHRRANQLMRGERAAHTLQPTGLIHEAFLRLVDQDVQAQSRQLFTAFVSLWPGLQRLFSCRFSLSFG